MRRLTRKEFEELNRSQVVIGSRFTRAHNEVYNWFSFIDLLLLDY